ncbi:MAG: O-antigen ligase family protein [Candidatus Pacebacteria bacterium]|nr:O-antigen ligase family protein [Candidatus Paceibacterota bacterium]
MNSWIVLKSKTAVGFFRAYLRRFSDDTVVLLLCLACSSILLTGIVSNFRLLVVATFILAFLLYLKINNLLVVSVLVSLFSLQFFNPNKYYTLEVIRGFNLALPELKNGYYLGYGVHVADIFFLLLSLSILGSFFMSSDVRKLLNIKVILTTLISLSMYYYISALSSIKYSPFAVASIIWLLQYGRLVLIFLAVLICTKTYKNFIVLIKRVIQSIVLTQFVVGLLQFSKKSALELPIEFSKGASFYTGLDESNLFFRISGTFLYHNQLGLIIGILLPILLFFRSKKEGQKSFDIVIIVLSCMLILFTQSRVAWIGLIAIAVQYVLVNKKEIANKWHHSRGKYTFWFRLILLSLVFSPIIVTRLQLSVNTIYQGAGLSIRLRMIKEASEALLYSPWIGYGVGTNEIVLFSLFPQGTMSVFPAAIHFAPVQILLESGVLGLIFLTAPFLFFFRYAVSRFNSKKLSISSGKYLHASLASAIFFSIYYLLQPHVGIVEFAFLGLVLSFGVIGYNLAQNNA